MATYQVLPLGIGTYFGDDDSNTVQVDGIRTQTGNRASYSYGVYDIATFGGDDVVYLFNLSAIDPAGVNPRARQTVDVGTGNDYVHISSLTAATVYGGDGDDTIVKIDLRSVIYGNPTENGWAGAVSFAGAPAGLNGDPNWTDFNIVDGGAGNDTIVMGNGNDWVYGGIGNDFISLGAGNNVAFAGDGNDTILIEGLGVQIVTGGLPPSATSRYAPSVNAIWAGDGDDVVTVNYVQNGTDLVAAINGEGGNDTITVSSTSASWITGGDGNDTITTIALQTSYVYTNQFAQPADTVWGQDGNDTIDTGLGNDLIVAGSGHDWVFVGFGSDQMYGGSGTGSDCQTDRFSFGEYHHRNFGMVDFGKSIKDVDSIYDFDPASRFPGQAGKGDIIDLAAMFAADDNDALVYDAGNPFLQGELRLLASGSDTLVQANDGAGGWDTFLVLYGVGIAELDITNQANVSAGLAGATGGDFLWFTG